MIEKQDRSFALAVFLLALVPVFSEWLAPFLTIGAVVFAVRDARSRGRHLSFGMVGRITLVYIAYLLITVLYSTHPFNSLATVAMWVVMFGGALTLSTVLTDTARLQKCLFPLAAAAGLVGGIALLQYLLRDVGGLSLPSQVWMPIDEWVFRYVPLDINLHMADNRAASTFTNPNILAEYLVLALPFVGIYNFEAKKTADRLFSWAFLLLTIGGAIVSFSRGAYLALLAVLLLVIVTNLHKVTPLILCLIAGIALIPEAVISRFMSIGNTADGAITERFEAWDVAARAILKSPLFGSGAGVSNLWELLQQNKVNAPHAHNLILQVLVEGGFVLLFLLCMIAGRLLQNSLQMLNHTPAARSHGVWFLGFFVSFVVYGMVEYPFLSPKLVGAFLLIVGFADATAAVYLNEPTMTLPQLLAALDPRRLLKKLRNRSH